MFGVGNRHSLRLSGATPKTQPWQDSNGIQGARTILNHEPGLSISLLEICPRCALWWQLMLGEGNTSIPCPQAGASLRTGPAHGPSTTLEGQSLWLVHPQDRGSGTASSRFILCTPQSQVPCIQEWTLLAEGQQGPGGEGRGLCMTTAE